jgi:hypothetical protein
MCRRLRFMLNSAYQWILKVQLAVESRHSLMLTPYGKVVYFLSVSSKVLVMLLGSKYGLSSVVGKMAVPPCPFTSFFFSSWLLFFSTFFALLFHVCCNKFRPVRFNIRLGKPKMCSSMRVGPLERAVLWRGKPASVRVSYSRKSSPITYVILQL